MVKLKSLFTPRIVLAGLLILGLFFTLRIISLDHLPVFVDEAIYVRWSQVMKNEPTLRFLPQSDGKQPLFMWITMPFLKLISDPLLAGRAVSIVSGTASLIGIGLFTYLLSKSLLSSLLASLLYAVVPFTVFYDRLALVDSMLSMFGIWTLILGLLFVKNPRLDYALLLGFSIGGGLLTKSPAVFFYLWLVVLSLFYFLPQLLTLTPPKRLIGVVKFLFLFLITVVVSQAMYNILRLGPNFHLIGSRNQDYLFSFSEVLTHPLNPLTGNLKNTLYWTFVLFTPPVFLLIPLSFIKDRKISLILLFICLLPLISQALIAKVYTSRYLMFSVTPLLILSAFGLTWLLEKSKRRLSLWPVLLLAPLYLSLHYAISPETAYMTRDMRHGYLEEWTAGWGQKQVAQYLIHKVNQGKPLVVGTEGFFGTLPDGLQIYTEGYPNITVIGVGQPISVIPSSLANTSKDNEIYLVVNRSRNLLSDQDLKQLELVLSFDKPARPNLTQEALQLYRFK